MLPVLKHKLMIFEAVLRTMFSSLFQEAVIMTTKNELFLHEEIMLLALRDEKGTVE